MSFQEVVKIARGMGINPYRKTKVLLIREIQRTEHNIDCYATARVVHCGETGCLWREDCLQANRSQPEKARPRP
ncbi:MAG: SAP domain-containing protein [bacterium]